VATGLLHLCGITIGTLSRSPAGGRLIRGLGASIAALGCYFLVRGFGGPS
jgi:urease accessory protein